MCLLRIYLSCTTLASPPNGSCAAGALELVALVLHDSQSSRQQPDSRNHVSLYTIAICKHYKSRFLSTALPEAWFIGMAPLVSILDINRIKAAVNIFCSALHTLALRPSPFPTVDQGHLDSIQPFTSSQSEFAFHSYQFLPAAASSKVISNLLPMTPSLWLWELLTPPVGFNVTDYTGLIILSSHCNIS